MLLYDNLLESSIHNPMDAITEPTGKTGQLNEKYRSQSRTWHDMAGFYCDYIFNL
jgi:hypothetical protein